MADDPPQVSFKDAMNWVGTIVGVVLGAASGIATIFTSAQVQHDRQEAVAKQAALEASVTAHQESDKEERDTIRQSLSQLQSQIENIDRQKNINTEAIASITAQVLSGKENETQGAKDADERLDKEISALREQLSSVQSRIDPEPGGQQANIREIRAEITAIQQRANDAYDRATEVQRQIALIENKERLPR